MSTPFDPGWTTQNAYPADAPAVSGESTAAAGMPVPFLRQVGTSGATAGPTSDRWYVVNNLSGNVAVGGSGTSFTTGRHHTIPLYSGKGGTLKDLGVYQFVASTAGSLKISVYDNTAATTLYPKNLVWQSSVLTIGTVGLKTATANQVLTAGTLYWVDVIANQSVQLAGMSNNAGWPLLGFDPAQDLTTSGGAGVGWYGATSAYSDTAPATFPTTSTVMTTATPAVFARFS